MNNKPRFESLPYTSNKKHLKKLEHFKKIEDNPHHDWRLIAWYMSIDYDKLNARCKKLEKEIQKLKNN